MTDLLHLATMAAGVLVVGVVAGYLFARARHSPWREARRAIKQRQRERQIAVDSARELDRLKLERPHDTLRILNRLAKRSGNRERLRK